MNKRIRELAEQARELATTRHPVSNITLSMNSDLFEQKFAQLIVRECAGICFSEAAGHGMAFGEHCGIIIKEHFGVE